MSVIAQTAPTWGPILAVVMTWWSVCGHRLSKSEPEPLPQLEPLSEAAVNAIAQDLLHAVQSQLQDEINKDYYTNGGLQIHVNVRSVR